eukprot:357811-Chlamydomonas_euryale.AAC.10
MHGPTMTRLSGDQTACILHMGTCCMYMSAWWVIERSSQREGLIRCESREHVFTATCRQTACDDELKGRFVHTEESVHGSVNLHAARQCHEVQCGTNSTAPSALNTDSNDRIQMNNKLGGKVVYGKGYALSHTPQPCEEHQPPHQLQLCV